MTAQSFITTTTTASTVVIATQPEMLVVFNGQVNPILEK
jgi:hypothetical protein